VRGHRHVVVRAENPDRLRQCGAPRRLRLRAGRRLPPEATTVGAGRGVRVLRGGCRWVRHHRFPGRHRCCWEWDASILGQRAGLDRPGGILARSTDKVSESRGRSVVGALLGAHHRVQCDAPRRGTPAQRCGGGGMAGQLPPLAAPVAQWTPPGRLRRRLVGASDRQGRDGGTHLGACSASLPSHG
jgi:hypothetical protein